MVKSEYKFYEKIVHFEMQGYYEKEASKSDTSHIIPAPIKTEMKPSSSVLSDNDIRRNFNTEKTYREDLSH